MTTPLAQKLQLKPGQRLAVLDSLAGYLERLSPALEGITVAAEATGQLDVVLLFVNSPAEAERLAPVAIHAVRPGGLLWIAYAKGTAVGKGSSGRQ